MKLYFNLICNFLKKDPFFWNKYIKSLYFNIFSTFFSITVGDGTRWRYWSISRTDWWFLQIISFIIIMMIHFNFFVRQSLNCFFVSSQYKYFSNRVVIMSPPQHFLFSVSHEKSLIKNLVSIWSTKVIKETRNLLRVFSKKSSFHIDYFCKEKYFKFDFVRIALLVIFHSYDSPFDVILPPFY